MKKNTTFYSCIISMIQPRLCTATKLRPPNAALENHQQGVSDCFTGHFHRDEPVGLLPAGHDPA